MSSPRDDGSPSRERSLSYDMPLIALMVAGIASKDTRVQIVVAGLAMLDEPVRRTPSPRG